MKKWWFIVAILVAFWLVTKPDSVPTGSGASLPIDVQPNQQSLSSAATFRLQGYQLTPVASFDIQAKVLAKKRYRTGREADISPFDLALGWGPMSDDSVLAAISISQSRRWYRWSTKNFPIPRRDIETNSANMHMIPANDSVRDALNAVREGQLVQLTGYLVNVDASDGWRWRTSQTRADTGNGACEIVYVEQLTFL